MRNIKISAVLTALLFTFTVFFADAASIRAEAAFKPSVNPYSTSYYMVNVDLDTVIAAHNENERCYPASLVKVMTAIVALEHCSDLSVPVKITYEATNEFWMPEDPNLDGAATIGFAVGQTNLTMEDCLYALMIHSACEVANVIAYNVGGGSIEKFIEMMNKKAAEIGCTGTHFSNTHGLWNKDTYSTAYDLYLIARYAYDKLPKLMEIANTKEYTFPANKYNPYPYTVTNINQLIMNVSDNPYYYEYAKGLKTGSINEYYENGETKPGFMNLISTASMNGFTYMLVTTGAPYYEADGTRTYAHFKDAIALYKWAFRTFDIMEVLSENSVITNLKVDMGENADVVTLKPSSSFATLVPMDLDRTAIEQRIRITAETNDNNKVVAPIEKGQVMGTLELVLNGEVIASRNLVASQSIALSQFEYTMRMINSIFDKGWFKLCIAALAVLIIADIILNSIQKSRIAKLEARQRRRNSISRYR